MSFSPDFSSVSANNWAVPTAASPTPADFPAQADAVPGDSTPALDTYLPSAPLLQQPEQDVYGNPLPPQTEGLSDTYTPSFAQPDATTAQTAPPITGHPLQTALATGVGALAGGTIGAVVKNTFFNEDEAPKKEGTKTQTKVDATATKSGWKLEKASADGKAPETVIDKLGKKYYTVENDAVKTYELKTDGTPGGPISPDPAKFTVTSDGKSKSRTLNGKTETYTQHPNNILEYTSSENHLWGKSPIEKKERFLIDTANKVVVEMKGEKILKVYDVPANPEIDWTKPFLAIGDRTKQLFGPEEFKIDVLKNKLKEFKTILSTEASDAFENSCRNSQKGWGRNIGQGFVSMPYATGREFTALLVGTQAKITKIANTEFSNLPPTETGLIESLDLLKTVCGFEPAKLIDKTKDAADKAKEWKLGEYALPVGLGVVVGAGALFGLDYWLQHRTPKKSTEAELA
ncbi:MAG: hypothetical protein NTW61_07240 [Candidatus Melainabacteria bacterium]|nr:hypothetical protein [Candidatus Melainabacteria bacterium]